MNTLDLLESALAGTIEPEEALVRLNDPDGERTLRDLVHAARLAAAVDLREGDLPLPLPGEQNTRTRIQALHLALVPLVTELEEPA